MFTTLVDAPFSREGWLFETKWDGYRAIASVQDHQVSLYSRNQLSFNAAYPPVVKAVEKIAHNVVLDGEVVVLEKGKYSDFQSLQHYGSTGRGNLVYVVFDLLHLNGHELHNMPLLERKTLLKEIVNQLGDKTVQYSAHVLKNGETFFDKAKTAGWEGIIAKKTDSVYEEGRRNLNWLKIKILNEQEAIICGYTAPRGSRKKIGALVLGLFEGERLRYIGHCGGGLNDAMIQDLYDRFQPLRQEQSPFKEKVKTNMPVTWLKPELVCQVKFSSWTEGGILRQPIVLGIRDDKSGKEVHREKPKKTNMATTGTTTAKKRAGAKKAAAGKEKVAGRKAAAGKPVIEKPTTVKKTAAAKTATAKAAGANTKSTTAKKATAKKAAVSKTATAKKATPKKTPAKTSPAKKAAEDKTVMEKDRTLQLNGIQVTLTNQQKIYWPKEKITKGQLIDYYLSVAKYILPHLKDRALSLNRFPNGITGPSFYQKDLDLKNTPAWVTSEPIYSETNDKNIDYMVCNNEATLAYMINLGCIEINPWLARTGNLENPDYIVLDLDPENIAFPYVVETALEIKKVLDEVGVTSYCKTSGASGLHIYVPVGARYSFDTGRLFAEYVATRVSKILPKTTSVIRAKSKRDKRVYIDFLQNRRGQTVAAPYAVRPKPGATVSTPLHWDEVNEQLNIKDYHIFNSLERINEIGELWKNIQREKNDLRKAIERIESAR